MNPKIEKLEKEIEKTKTKIAEMQAKLHKLEEQKTELENTDYVAVARSFKLTPQQLADFLKSQQAAPSETVLPQDVAIVIISKLPKSLVVLFIISGLIVCILFALDSRIQINRFNLLKTNILLFIRKITCNSYPFCLFAGLL